MYTGESSVPADFDIQVTWFGIVHMIFQLCSATASIPSLNEVDELVWLLDRMDPTEGGARSRVSSPRSSLPLHPSAPSIPLFLSLSAQVDLPIRVQRQ